MSTFKECVANDITTAFMNANEFAEDHVISDVTINCIVQDVNIAEDLTIDRAGNYLPDIYGEAKTINVPKGSLATVPVYGEILILDGERYEVVSVADDMGMLTIVVTGNRR